jgi:HK97 family phage portal protein
VKAPRILSRFFDRWFAGTPNDADDFWYQPITGLTLSGQRVTPDSSLRTAAVYACVRVLTETIASLPLIVYRREDNGGKTRARNHPLFTLLHDQPNSWQTAYEFIEMMQGHLEMRGNAYAEIIPGRRGFVDQLIPLHPDKVEVEVLKNGQLDYLYRERPGNIRRIEQDMMFHVRGWGSNGYVGSSPIALAAEAVGMSLAAQEYGARFFENDASPGGVLEHPGSLKNDAAAKRMRDSWQEAHTGKNRSKIAILEQGLKYTQIGLTNKDAQFLESRKFQAEEIARIFRVQPHKIGLLDKATFSNIEHQAIEFVVDTIRPRVRRWEQAIQRDLILQKGTFFAEFLIDGLLRGDIKSRYEAYKIALGGAGSPAFMRVNEVRVTENMNPIGPEGDQLVTPMNVQPQPPDREEEESARVPPKPNGSASGFDAGAHGEGE